MNVIRSLKKYFHLKRYAVPFKMLLLGAILFSQSCDRVEIDFFQLGDFRILAIEVDQPEVNGEIENTVTLTPWISDLDAEGRTISLDILACPDPGISFGAEPTCDESSSTTQRISYADFDASSLSSDFYTGAMPAFTVDIPSGFLINAIPERERFNGLDYIVSFVFQAGSDEIKSFKRIKVSSKTNLNQNPQIENILWEGDIAGTLNDNTNVTYEIANNFQPEEYEEQIEDGSIKTKTEEYLMTWFVSGGVLKFSRTEPDLTNVFNTDPDITGPAFLVGVLRDNRGGIDVVLKK